MDKSKIIAFKRVHQKDNYVLMVIDGNEGPCRVDDDKMRFRVEEGAEALYVQASSVCIGRPNVLYDPVVIGTKAAIEKFLAAVNYTLISDLLAEEEKTAKSET